MDLATIGQKLREEKLSPGQLSELRMKLAGAYQFIASRLDDILMANSKSGCISETSLNQSQKQTANGNLLTMANWKSSIATNLKLATG